MNIFTDFNENSLEKKVDDYLHALGDKLAVVDIKLSTTNDLEQGKVLFTAMIITKHVK